MQILFIAILQGIDRRPVGVLQATFILVQPSRYRQRVR
jgi:hypothetical protein